MKKNLIKMNIKTRTKMIMLESQINIQDTFQVIIKEGKSNENIDNNKQMKNNVNHFWLLEGISTNFINYLIIYIYHRLG